MRNNKNFGLSPDLVDAVRNIIAGKPVEEGGMKRGKDLDTFKPKKEDDELDAVNPVAVKKKFKDRKDKDIDNDGDTDSSDKFLHKKRKAISKAISKDDEDDVEESFKTFGVYLKDEEEVDLVEKLSLKDFKVGMFIQGKGGKVGKIISNQPRGELINVQWNKGGREEMQIKGLGLYTKPRLQGLVREDRDDDVQEAVFTKKDFDKNEDNNMHTENAVELARKFGSKKEFDKMVAIYKSHMKRGSISRPEQMERDKLVKKYLPKLKEDVEVEESIGNVKVNPRKPSPFPTKGVTVSKHKIKGKSMPPVPAGGKPKKEEDEPEDDDNGEDKPKTKKKANGNGKKDEIDVEPELDEYITKEGDRRKVKNGDGRRKSHDCAQKVVHEQWGLGSCLPQMHAIPDEEGTIAWYDVVFNHGVEREVDITELKVVSSGVHSH